MARGYLANWKSVPPLIFRFQFNPDLLQEKKSYKYEEANNFGTWDFEGTSAASSASAGALAIAAGIYDDLEDLGARLIETRPLAPREGGQRIFAIDFQLDSRVNGEGITAEIANPYEGSIEPDLAILRSFMVPTIDVVGVIKGLAGNFEDREWLKPPKCALIYGGLSVDCVMEHLNIKITLFNDDHTPQRAEVSVTLKQQSKSLDPIIESITRTIDVCKSYGREGFGEDYVAVLPGVSAIRHIFEI